MNHLHQYIDQLANDAHRAIKLEGMRAKMQIDDIVVRYKNQDVFRRRSEGQKRRYQQIKQGEVK